MSSKPPAETGRRRRLLTPRSWSLRIRLLVTLVALLAMVCVGIGIGTELALHRFLLNQLDEQVANSGHRSVMTFALGPPPHPRLRPPPPPFAVADGPGPMFLGAPGQATRTVGAVVSGGRVVSAGVITAGGVRQPISPTAAAQLANLTPVGHAVTVDLDGLGRYRLIAVATRAGPIVVSGLPTAPMDRTLLRVAAIFSAVAGIALVAATAIGIVLIRRQLAPLSRVSAAARDVANLELDKGEVNLPTPIVSVAPDAAHTEVGQLGIALNRMLDRIASALSARHASETRVRQFLADASHELRTPLAAISGYTELVQRRREDLPAEVAHAMSRVESESARMTQLVEDMLLLARLDEGRPLERDTVDLSQLAVNAVSDAHIAGPDHEWLLELPDEPVTVIGDRARLQQVLANLLTNSRTHTPSGTSVTTSLAAEGDHGAVFSVVDDGPGIPSEQQPEIFGRFVRGDSSRSRRDGSTGLGLAIVSAGHIDMESHPGRTAFTVRLPGSRSQPA
jgi:two-component system, OmpR family, sensor kinase